MTKINWKIRLKNKSFWMAIVPALLLTGQRVADVFGFSFDLDDQQANILALINACFVVLALIGVVSDPTVQGFADSHRAMQYDEPVLPIHKESEQGTKEIDVQISKEAAAVIKELEEEEMLRNETGQVDAE